MGQGPSGLVPVAGIMDSNPIGLRPMRTDEIGSLRVTSETLLNHDAFEGSNINALWTQSTSNGMTIAQAAGILTLNANATIGGNSVATITSKRQFAKLPGQILCARFRIRMSASDANSSISLGFGSPPWFGAATNRVEFTATTSVAAGFLYAYNGTGAGIINTVIAPTAGKWFNVDVYVADSFVRCVVTDAGGTIFIDGFLPLSPTNSPQAWAGSHLPVYASVASAAGAANALTFDLAFHSVSLLDTAAEMPFSEQMAAVGRAAQLSPIDQSQTAQAANAAPAGGTPSNTAALYTTLGGDYIATLTAASENILSLFAYTVPSPYSFMLTGLVIPAPFVSTVLNIAAPLSVLEWFLVANCATANINTGGGQRISLGINPISSGTAAVGTQLNGGTFTLTFKAPILCLPGTVLHIAWKVSVGGAVTGGAVRGSVVVDGYFI